MAVPVRPADDPVLSPVFQRLAADAPRWLDARHVDVVQVGREERPFSVVLKVALRPAAGGHDGFNVFVKVFKPKDPAAGIDLHERVRRDFATTRSVFDFMARWPDTGVVKPLACYDDLLTLVTQETVGVTLLQRLHAGATWFPGATALADLKATLANVGLWLRRYQEFEPGDRRVTPDALAEYVDVRLRRLVDRGVFEQDERRRILDYVGGLARRATDDERREVAVHADLAPANVLVSAAGIVVLDLAMAGRGSRLQDASRLFMQLDVLRAKPQFRPATVAALQRALLEGLDASFDHDHPLFRCALMVHRVNHLGTLSLGKESGLARLLSARVARLHRKWIAAELETLGSAG